MMFKVVAILVIALIAVSEGKTKTPKAKVVSEALPDVEGKQCSLGMKEYLSEDKEPLILTVTHGYLRDAGEMKRLDVARPEVENGKDGVIKVNDKEELMVVCTGIQNTVADTGEESVSVTCKNGELTETGGSKVTPRSLACKKTLAYSWLRVTDETCGTGDNNGVMVQLGFQMKDRSFFPEVDLCHNITLGHTYWAGHSLYGHSIRGSVKSSKRRTFSRGSKKLYLGVTPDLLYAKATQKLTLDKILGKGQSDKYLKKDFLARGHLAPDADFIFQREQMLTYYFANAAPQWQTFNAGNWLTLENTVRDLAAKNDHTLNVYTGTYGILTLTDTSNKYQEIFLEPKKQMIPVPEAFWKVVQNPVTKSCTVAVGHNNVFMTEAPTPLCAKTLPDGWPKNNLDNFDKGYTYYCDYHSFFKAVNYGPLLECKDLFEFPESKAE